MVKVRYVVGGSFKSGLSGGSLSGGSLSGGCATNPETELTAGAQVPWFRGFYTVPLNLFVVQVISAIAFFAAAIYNFVNVQSNASTSSQETMAIIFLVLSIWFAAGWPLVVYSLA